MGKCQNCFKTEGIHRWGKYWVCDDCNKILHKELKSSLESPDLKISKESSLMAWADYYHGENIIVLHRMSDSIEVTLAHETMHHILNVFVDPPTSYDYDLISPTGEIHRELFAV